MIRSNKMMQNRIKNYFESQITFAEQEEEFKVIV